ncbi:hypothetical protein ERO13_D05G256000v2 [Gossypium hirsutum]|uniref:Oleosin H2 n=2 Tax=Gossypium TaxID=3633 RepID=A0A1U8K9V7_GOSHI|nr:oleosin H2-like [Gossypium hirsutum]KAG4147959.1 hypothetical protein ERO13_D05G256000v2 [Gossypium hirsutum]TYH72804.1 hypothetical protein ES332_D05G280800v1 [Gossypium tomentosum]
MAEHRQQLRQTDDMKNFFHENGPSTSKVLTVATLLPVGGTLLLLAGLSLIGSLIGLAIAAPLFLIFSPVLVPAALLIAGSIAGFLTSGAFGITGLSSLSWIANYIRGSRSSMSQGLDPVKWPLPDTAVSMEQKIQNRSQGGGRISEGGREQEGGKSTTQEGGKSKTQEGGKSRTQEGGNKTVG